MFSRSPENSPAVKNRSKKRLLSTTLALSGVVASGAVLASDTDSVVGNIENPAAATAPAVRGPNQTRVSQAQISEVSRSNEEEGIVEQDDIIKASCAFAEIEELDLVVQSLEIQIGGFDPDSNPNDLNVEGGLAATTVTYDLLRTDNGDNFTSSDEFFADEDGVVSISSSFFAPLSDPNTNVANMQRWSGSLEAYKFDNEDYLNGSERADVGRTAFTISIGTCIPAN